jgi:hypothetical protein
MKGISSVNVLDVGTVPVGLRQLKVECCHVIITIINNQGPPLCEKCKGFIAVCFPQGGMRF